MVSLILPATGNLLLYGTDIETPAIASRFHQMLAIGDKRRQIGFQRFANFPVGLQVKRVIRQFGCPSVHFASSIWPCIMQLTGVTLSAANERTISRQCCAELIMQTAAAISIMASLFFRLGDQGPIAQITTDPAG
jgi:hypothetical protein